MPQSLPPQEQSTAGSQALPMGRQSAVPYSIQYPVSAGYRDSDFWYLLVSGYLSMARKPDVKLSSPLAGLGLTR